ncbi:hypothetical protein CDAR_369311 [Caerostris darwini]|uniref:Uncharacterized protein n=1 Tax=Caerostris darwini TaxID=1538125 RepID=A0AAV4S179_9ARAC|nr:hypothetical protein CDAR_369311 [Caerostris darwini]
MARNIKSPLTAVIVFICPKWHTDCWQLTLLQETVRVARHVTIYHDYGDTPPSQEMVTFLGLVWWKKYSFKNLTKESFKVLFNGQLQTRKRLDNSGSKYIMEHPPPTRNVCETFRKRDTS